MSRIPSRALQIWIAHDYAILSSVEAIPVFPYRAIRRVIESVSRIVLPHSEHCPARSSRGSPRIGESIAVAH